MCIRRHRMTRGLLVLGAVSAALAAPPAASASGSGSAASAGSAVSYASLSNEHTLTRWAYPQSAASVHSAPAAGSATVGRLQFLTSDEQAELYVALGSARLPSGRVWIRVEVPGRPNGVSGWVPRGALGTFKLVHSYLQIDRASLRATLYRDGHVVFSAPVGVGKAGTITPAGHFYVDEKLTTLDDPTYGPYAIGTSAFAPTLSEWPGGGVVGIHGTDEPQLIPGRPSHGCIRMRNADITRLWHMIELGTPIEII
jgi:L,D-transpeptidase catalytic domain